jgi:tripartite ATP-independent transporter DctM subunit
MILALMVASMFGLLLLRIPVAFAMLFPCMAYVVISPDITLGVALQRTLAPIDSFPLLAVPLFMMTGYISNASGLADRLFRLMLCLFGRIPGSLAYVNVACGVLFSWMSGAAVADAAGLGTVLVPAMKKRGYDEGFAIGLTGASALIGPIMPPSIPAIIFAVTAGVSVGKLFIAGVVPAILMACVLCVNVFLYVRKHPNLDQHSQQTVGLKQAFWEALPTLFTPVIILGGILGGVFSPTEAAAFSALYLLLLSAIYRSMSLQQLWQVLLQTVATTGTIMIIVAAAGFFGWIIAREQGPQALTKLLTEATSQAWVFLLLLNVFLLIIGTLLEPVSALLILVPILLPVAMAYGIEPLHLGMIMIFNLVIGLLTPPVGLVLYVLSSVTGASLQKVVRGSMPFLVPLLIVLLAVTYIPELSTWLPSLVFQK